MCSSRGFKLDWLTLGRISNSKKMATPAGTRKIRGNVGKNLSCPAAPAAVHRSRAER